MAQAVPSLADVVPTHDAGEMQLPSGRWVSGSDGGAWHEAGHAIVALASGRRVLEVTLDYPGRPGYGLCRSHTDKPRTSHELDWACQCRGAEAVAGAVAANKIRSGLGIAEPIAQERVSDEDFAQLKESAQMSPGVRSDAAGLRSFQLASQRVAGQALRAHPEAFGALVRALLERRTLHEAEILELWQQHAEANAG